MPATPPVSSTAYAAIAGMPEFQLLLARRRRFVLAALGFAILWFGGFLLLTSYAHGFMQHILVPGLSVAYVLGLSQFVLVWGLTAAYLKTSRESFDVLQDAVVNRFRELVAAEVRA